MAILQGQALLARQSEDTTHNRAVNLMEMLNACPTKLFGNGPRKGASMRKWRRIKISRLGP